MRSVIGWSVLLVLVLLLAIPSPSAAGGHVFFSFNIPLWVGPGWWGPAPYYYPAPPVAVQQPSVVYERSAPSQPQAPTYWYYCPNPQGYYPYIQQCPAGWLQVVPQTTPPHP
jgi:hypothetical protein